MLCSSFIIQRESCFEFVIGYRQDVGRVQLHKIQDVVQVMCRPKISSDKTYVGNKYTNFITSSGIIHALFVSDRLYVKDQNASCFGWSKSSLQPIFSTVKLLFVRNYTNYKTFREQKNQLDHFVRVVASFFIEHESTKYLMWHMHHHY